MRILFIFIASFGFIFLSMLVLLSDNPSAVNKYKNKFKFSGLTENMANEDLDSLLTSCNIGFDSRFYNFVRLNFIFLTFILLLIRSFLMKSASPILYFAFIPISVLWIILTSGKQGFPAYAILIKIQKAVSNRKNGQLLAFMHLYKNDRSRDGKKAQFWSFCYSVAPSLPLLERELMELSSRSAEDGIDSAMKWFEGLYPEDHSFANEIFSIILSTEKAQNQEAIKVALTRQGELLARISSNRYAEKWKNIGDLSSALNTVPAIVILMTMIILIFNYITIINKNLFY